MLGQTGPPVEQYQGGVEAEPEAERASKKRRVAEPDVVESPVRDIQNWQPGRQGQGAAQPSGTSKKELNSGEETGNRFSRSKRVSRSGNPGTRGLPSQERSSEIVASTARNGDIKYSHYTRQKNIP